MMGRHSSLAEQLAAIKAYRARPETEGPMEPIKTNWSTVPANDNNPEDVEGMRVERLLEITPSVEEIMREVKNGEVERNADGQVVAIGRLRFSDGTQTEQAMKLTIDGKVVAFQARMPVGAMLGTDDKLKAQRGGDENPQERVASNRYFAEMLNTRPHRYVSGKKAKRGGRNYTATESRAMLAEATANTDPTKITYTRYPDGLPCGSAKVADSFVGMKKIKCGESVSMMWQDIASSIVEREIWSATMAAITQRDDKVLEVAVTARNFSDIGQSLGFTGKRAERRGKRALITANDNLSYFLKEYAA